ncbi:hypothetical protein D3C72_2406880 [compost metagenome]
MNKAQHGADNTHGRRKAAGSFKNLGVAFMMSLKSVHLKLQNLPGQLRVRAVNDH